MKLISVQSNGDRLARVIQDHDTFRLHRKFLYYDDSGGFEQSVYETQTYTEVGRALKAAAEWIKGAQV